MADSPDVTRSSSSPWSVTNLVALVIVVVVLGGLAWTFGDEGAGGSDRSIEDDFFAAYEQSRSGTYVVDAEFSRTMADGRELRSASRHALRPPDELRWELGSASGRLGDRQLNCTPTGDEGSMQCAPSAEVEPWSDEVATELANLRSYFEGNRPVYRVERAGPGCFVLVQVLLELPDAPFGRETTMCFDPDTGARIELELRREGGSVDRVHAIEVRSEVGDADFSLAESDGFQPRSDGS